MNEVLDEIKKIEDALEDVIYKNNIKYLGYNIKDILTVYDADFCSLMSDIFKGSIIMINKDNNKCAIMIDGSLYNAYGLVNKNDYTIANAEQLGYIQKGFFHLSEDIMEKVLYKLNENTKLSYSYKLRKNRKNLT